MFSKSGKPVLGIDIGNVITGDTDKAVLFSEGYLGVSQIENAFTAIALLNRLFEGRVCLISKCKGPVQVKTRHWLEHHGFFGATGVKPNHVFFCETREGKHPICKQLGVTYFIDDRLEVLGYLETVKYKFLFCPDEKEVEKNVSSLPYVTRVDSWEELLEKLPFP